MTQTQTQTVFETVIDCVYKGNVCIAPYIVYAESADEASQKASAIYVKTHIAGIAFNVNSRIMPEYATSTMIAREIVPGTMIDLSRIESDSPTRDSSRDVLINRRVVNSIRRNRSHTRVTLSNFCVLTFRNNATVSVLI